MSGHRPGAALGLAVVLAVACTPSPAPVADTAAIAPGQATDSPARPAVTPDAGIDLPAGHAAQRAQARRNEAFREGVAVVNAYLRHAGAGERAEAELLWAARRLPPDAEEAGLRTWPLHALRYENDIPRALDAEAVPASLEVPVRLRATLQDGSTQRYTGWYRVRRNAVAARWELTAAALRPVLN